MKAPPPETAAAPAPKKRQMGRPPKNPLPPDDPRMQILPPSPEHMAQREAERAAGKPKKKGPRSVTFTKEQRQTVIDLATHGLPQHMIAAHIINPQTGEPISVNTLFKHFLYEIRSGALKANAALSKSAYHQAVGTPAEYDKRGNLLRAERYPSATMTIFLLRSRLQYSWKGGVGNDQDPFDSPEVDNAIASGAIAAPGLNMQDELAKLSDDDRETLREILARALRPKLGSG